MKEDENGPQPGMTVESTDGALQENDLTAPTVTEVATDAAGEVTHVEVEKGLIFRKKIAVPAERITRVENGHGGDPGAVVIDADARELGDLGAAGEETLAAHASTPPGVLSEVEEIVPTAEGMRRKEAAKTLLARRGAEQGAAPVQADKPTERKGIMAFLRTLGPGFLGGMAGNDASAVTSYSVAGATNGYSQLWLMLLATPLLQSVQYSCAKLGRITQRGLAEVLREHYGRGVAGAAALLVIVANLALLASDLAAIGSGIELITGLHWTWLIVPVALAIWYVTVFRTFETIKRVFLAMSLAFAAYLITGITAHPDWGKVLHSTFIPQINPGFAFISSAVALLGATVSPYMMFWQVQGEKEERRPGSRKSQLREAVVDIGTGVFSGNLVAYFIIVSTAATLFARGTQITSAADAARALEPLLGPAAKYFFAFGLIGAALVAIPVLLASTAYAVTGTFGWAASLWKQPWQNEGFYLILSGALGISLVVALVGLDPIRLMFWANVVQGVLAPALVVLVLIVGNSRRVMRDQRLGRPTSVALVCTALVMATAAVLLFVGLFTGQGV